MQELEIDSGGLDGVLVDGLDGLLQFLQIVGMWNDVDFEIDWVFLIIWLVLVQVWSDYVVCDVYVVEVGFVVSEEGCVVMVEMDWIQYCICDFEIGFVVCFVGNLVELCLKIVLLLFDGQLWFEFEVGVLVDVLWLLVVQEKG